MAVPGTRSCTRSAASHGQTVSSLVEFLPDRARPRGTRVPHPHAIVCTHAPPRRCVVAAAGDQAVWHGRLRQRAARILTDGTQDTSVTRPGVAMLHCGERRSARSASRLAATIRRSATGVRDRRARRAFRRAPAPRNGMHDAAWLITVCNEQVRDKQAACGRDTMRPAAGGPDYVENEMRCRPFRGISMNITGNRPFPSCRKVVFATD